MKKFKLMLVAVASALAASVAFAADFNLNVSSSLTVDDPMFKGLQQFKDGVEKNSGGKISASSCSQLTTRLRRRRAGTGTLGRRRGGAGRWRPSGTFRQGIWHSGRTLCGVGFTEMRKVVTSPLVEDGPKSCAQRQWPPGPVVQLVSG
jgi:hypothetical protein